MVGCYGAGKSTFWRNYFSQYSFYKRVDDDALVSENATMAACKEFLKDEKNTASVVIDFCGGTRNLRAKYIKIA